MEEIRREEVNGITGKNVLWASLITILLSALMVNVGTSPMTNTKIYIDPGRIPELGKIGHPGDEYTMSVKIDKVEDLYAVGFIVKFAPYASVLVASNVIERDFLLQDGHNTTFTYKINVFEGTIKIGISRLGAVCGASGSGTLATFKVTVREAGESQIELADTVLIKSNGQETDHQTRNSHYYGSTAVLASAVIFPGRNVKAGEDTAFRVKVRSKCDIRLNVRVRFDIERLEDGRRITLYSGQTYWGGGIGEPLQYEYLYANEFNEWYYEWNNPATNALGTPDGAYIEGDANAQWASLYSFEDITLGDRRIQDITIEGYSQYPNGPNDYVDIDLYGFSSVQGFAWFGSNYGEASWGWHGVRWVGGYKVTDVMPELRDEAELNGMELLIYNYHGDTPDVIRVDSIRLKVVFASITPVIRPIYLLEPFAQKDLEASWVTKLNHTGTYVCTANIEYTSEFKHWNSWGSRPKTFTLKIVKHPITTS